MSTAKTGTSGDRRVGVWVGLKPCGCCVGACREGMGYKDEKAHNDAVKLEWLDNGLTVLFATEQEFRETYFDNFLACPHTKVEGLDQ